MLMWPELIRDLPSLTISALTKMLTDIAVHLLIPSIGSRS